MIIKNETILREPCDKVTSKEEVFSLIGKLEKELKKCERRGKPGIGLAAPQIGEKKK